MAVRAADEPWHGVALYGALDHFRATGFNTRGCEVHLGRHRDLVRHFGGAIKPLDDDGITVSKEGQLVSTAGPRTSTRLGKLLSVSRANFMPVLDTSGTLGGRHVLQAPEARHRLKSQHRASADVDMRKNVMVQKNE